MTIFLDLDNTLYDAKFCYNYSISKLEQEWKDRHFTGNFIALYERARKETKETLFGHTSNRLRILCFKKMFDEIEEKIMPKEIILFQNLYYKYFKEAILLLKKEYSNKYNFLYKSLKEISQTKKIFILTNENLTTQLVKLETLLPKNLNINLFTSEEVGFEKPNSKFFKYVFQKTKTKKNQSFMIGDNFEDDIKGSLNSGLKAIHQLEIFGDKNFIEKKKLSSKEYYITKNIFTSLEIVSKI